MRAGPYMHLRSDRILVVLCLLAGTGAFTGCGETAPGKKPRGSPGTESDALSAAERDARRVLVVGNSQDPSSETIRDYYADRRGIPGDRRFSVSVSPKDEIPLREYDSKIERPVRNFLRRRHLADEVDFIVLIRGVPLRIREGGYSVDAFLAAMDLDLKPIPDRKSQNFRRPTNPYFEKDVPFHKRDFGFYLVTRLDGYTPEDAMRLVDASAHSSPNRGPFLFDLDPRRDSGGYERVNRSMREADRILRSRGMRVTLEQTNAFASGDSDLAGYYSWGSNDGGYLPEAYRTLRFLPGAIAETAVSTSARTFRPTEGGQSLVADLIRSGVTGVKGYVSEPLTIALCPADLLFDRYTSGYTLAESYYMAMPFLKWKDVVVGDPLCAPYRRGAAGSDVDR